MKTSDYRNTFFIGIVSAILWFFVLQHLSLSSKAELIAIVAAIPFLFLLAVYATHAIFRGAVFHKFAKFMVVGIMNTGVDFFIFNTLIAATGMARGLPLMGFKTLSFIGAMLNSFFLNRAWTFDEEATPGARKSEFARFAAITVVGFLVNVGTTTVVANGIAAPFGISQVRWDNIAAVGATALNLIWNFIGYKLFVFKGKGKHPLPIPEPELI